MIDGEADAYVVSTGKVFPLARNIKNENRALHLIPVLYLPSTLSAEEYPNLLSPGETIDTLATSVLPVTFNWPEKFWIGTTGSRASWMRSSNLTSHETAAASQMARSVSV
jgi:hypothetical protein